MQKIRLKNDFSHSAIMYVLKTRRDQYIKKHGVQPICLYCSTDTAGIWPSALCSFAVKNGLRIAFLPKDGADPWISFGEEHEEVFGND